MKILVNMTIFLFILFNSEYSFAQKEFNNWYCNNSLVMSFNTPSGIPQVLDQSNMWEGYPASISDKYGNLLFYTNGVNVWNKNHEIMENGDSLTGDNVDANSTVVGQILIIELPNSNGIYYIFVANDWHYQNRLNNNTLYYSIVDINKNNGNGKVIQKNIFLTNSSSGQLNACFHQNKKDIWVIAGSDRGNSFTSYLLSDKGIATAVTSSFDKVLPDEYYDSGNLGPLVKSLDGSKFATSYTGSVYELNNLMRRDTYFEIYDFDVLSGKFTQRQVFKEFYNYPNINNLINLSMEKGLYNVKLSPDGSKLYCSFLGLSNNNWPGSGYFRYIFQLDLTLDSATMVNNCTLLNLPDRILHKGSMQIGPDKKLYINGDQHISVINKPNLSAYDCDYQSILMAYGSIDSRIFPNDILISEYITAKPHSDTVCFGEDVVIKGNVNSAMPTETILWEGPNGFSSNDSNLYFPNATNTINGWYKITATSNGDTITDSTYVLVFPKNPDVLRIIPSDSTALCRYGSVLLAINKPRNDYKYLWSTGDTTESINVNQEGKYYITISDSNGCEQYDSIRVFIKDIKPEIEIIGNTPTCDGDTVIFRAKEEYAKYNWTTGDTTRELILTKSTRCELSVIDSLGCSGTSESAEVIFYTVPKTILKGKDRVCLGAEERYSINKTSKDTVIWEIKGGLKIANSGTDTIMVKWNTPGNGKIIVKQVSNVGCVGMDSIEVFVVDDVKPEILPKKKVICGNGNLTLSTVEKYGNYEWSTGETTEQITVSTIGEYWLKVTDIAGCEGTDTVQVTRANEPQPQITGNPFLCNGETTVLSTSEIYEKYLWNTGDTTQSIIVSTPGIYSIEITDTNGCRGTASIDVKTITIQLSGLKDIDFGRVGIGNDSEQTITLTNNTNEAVTINRIYTKNSTNEFVITTNPTLQQTFAENENIGIEINFEPENLQEYIDSLVIEIMSPCQVNYLNELSGIGTAKLFVSLPDLIYPVDTTICIPITGKLISNNKINIKTTYNTTISYESSAFYPNFAFQKVGNDIQVKLENQELNIGTESKVIGEICGGVLLANQKTTDLIFKEFTSINPYLDIETQDGSLTIAGCVIDLSRIHLSEQLEILLKPNPASDAINLQIRSSEANNYKIAIYNLLGIQQVEFEIELNAEQSTIPIEISNLSAGVYFVVVKKENEVFFGKFTKSD